MIYTMYQTMLTKQDVVIPEFGICYHEQELLIVCPPLCPDAAAVQSLVDILNESAVEPLHLMDIFDDFLQKI